MEATPCNAMLLRGTFLKAKFLAGTSTLEKLTENLDDHARTALFIHDGNQRGLTPADQAFISEKVKLMYEAVLAIGQRLENWKLEEVQGDEEEEPTIHINTAPKWYA